MPLPAPQPRQEQHCRTAIYRGYKRDDGLWDIEAQMSDVKTIEVQLLSGRKLPPGEPMHEMQIRLTVGDDMVIREIASNIDRSPFTECRGATDPMQKMVGARLGAGWRQAIDRALGAHRGCTHLRETLFNMATVGFQLIPTMKTPRDAQGKPLHLSDKPPHFLGRCFAYDFDGPVVARLFPEFAGYQPVRVVRPEKA
jgi:hypothetical protein